MKFSEYVVLEKSGLAVDPLGFRRPSGALQDMLFPQFTVLTLHPAYLEALCCFIQTHNSSGAQDQRQYARHIRVLEIFWGLANAEAGQSVINVTKYQSIRADEVRVDEIPARHPIFQRLAYGTLGHYSRSAMRWGLLEASGRRLLPAGDELANAFSNRHKGQKFLELLQDWRAGKAFSRSALAQVGRDFGIGGQPSSTEKLVWQKIIQDGCQSHSKAWPLWQSPMTWLQLASGQEGSAQYQELWQSVHASYPTLKKEIEAIMRFERLAAAAQFIFDRRVTVLEFGGQFEDSLPLGADLFAASVVQLAKVYVAAPAFQDARRLFRALAVTAPDFRSLTRCIVEHHMQHQQAKGTSPFISHTEVLVNDRVDRFAVEEAMTAYGGCADPKGQIEALQFLFRRQWHFEKCRRWSDWSLGISGDFA